MRYRDSDGAMSLQEDFQREIDKVIRKINNETESLCVAFIKETGLKPSECEIVHQVIEGGYRIFIRRRGP